MLNNVTPLKLSGQVCYPGIAMAKERKIGRQKAVSDLKRELILDAARKVFEADGLEGASLRAIACNFRLIGVQARNTRRVYVHC